MVAIDSSNQVDLIPLSIEENNFHANLLSDNENILIATSSYNNSDPININFTVSIDDSTLVGDVNLDGSVDVLDVVSIVNIILDDSYTSYGDINADGELDVIDIVLLIEMILV